MEIKRINPQNLSGPRAYFTDFDHRIVQISSNPEILQRNSERKLKVLLLLKSHIVCAASHLATKFAYNFFKKNPILLNSEAIIPAFRSDKTDLKELFLEKNFIGVNDAINFFTDNVHTTVTWKLEDNSSWFRDQQFSMKDLRA